MHTGGETPPSNNTHRGLSNSGKVVLTHMTQRTMTNGMGVEIKYRTQIIMGNVGRGSLTQP